MKMFLNHEDVLMPGQTDNSFCVGIARYCQKLGQASLAIGETSSGIKTINHAIATHGIKKKDLRSMPVDVRPEGRILKPVQSSDEETYEEMLSNQTTSDDVQISHDQIKLRNKGLVKRM